MAQAVAALYPDWPQYAARICDGVRRLLPEQLAIRAGPQHGAIWILAAHIAEMRVYWLCGVFGELGAAETPWPRPLSDTSWEDDPTHPRSGEELACALDSSWHVVEDVLARWTVDGLGVTAERISPSGETQIHTRASVLNRLCSHDAFHAGEISQLLGLHGLPAIDLWARHPPG